MDGSRGTGPGGESAPGSDGEAQPDSPGLFDVVLLGDRPIASGLMAEQFRRSPAVRMVYLAGSSAEAEVLLGQTASGAGGRAPVLIVSLDQPGKPVIDLIAGVRVGRPDTTVIVLSDPDQGLLLDGAVRAGVDGVVLRRSRPDRLRIVALRAVEGAVHIDPELAVALLRLTPWRPPTGDRLRQIRKSLGAREMSVLRALARGQTDREIAATLDSDIETIRTHLGNALRKMGADSRMDGVLFAIRYGIIPLRD